MTCIRSITICVLYSVHNHLCPVFGQQQSMSCIRSITICVLYSVHNNPCPVFGPQQSCVLYLVHNYRVSCNRSTTIWVHQGPGGREVHPAGAVREAEGDNPGTVHGAGGGAIYRLRKVESIHLFYCSPVRLEPPVDLLDTCNPETVSVSVKPFTPEILAI